MSDFYMSAGFLRGEMAAALANNPEQLAWVLGELSERVNVEELMEEIDGVDADLGKMAEFYRELAEALAEAAALDDYL